ncbi:UbiX family flavin prenyltransferase [Clostridium thermarum]|uniref:UbiX family flavin prenyltransferase n=1 Tax=Clostridium thermarum TaxID=1716543 RepID=UPI0011234D78|nr:flavin prenyltransferase UbiX [Clostridium thermarum]
MKKIVIGITGASGSIYAVRLIEELLKNDVDLYIICTETGKKVMEFETGIAIDEWIENLRKCSNNIHLEDINNLFSNVASGSFKFDSMIVLPCSMGTLAEISSGLAKNLLCRAADVALKENRRLIIVPRETPFNAIHLENMLKLSKLGVTILPAMPGFYHKPATMEDLVNFVIGKILDSISIENTLFKKWGD